VPEVGDFIAPAGELTLALFPDVTLTESVAAWLEQAEGLTDDEDAQAAWVYHRAYAHVADRLHAGLANESKGPVSAARSDAQFRYWQGRAATLRRRFYALTRDLDVTW
jgi:hypothetical protein